jgi:hypothetical protein
MTLKPVVKQETHVMTFNCVNPSCGKELQVTIYPESDDYKFGVVAKSGVRGANFDEEGESDLDEGHFKCLNCGYIYCLEDDEGEESEEETQDEEEEEKPLPKVNKYTVL